MRGDAVLDVKSDERIEAYEPPTVTRIGSVDELTAGALDSSATGPN